MSRSANPYLLPALGGAALCLGVAYGVATRGYKADVAESAAARASAAEARAASAEARVAAGNATVAELNARLEELAARQEEREATASVGMGDPMPESVSLDLGRAATAAEVAAWNIDVRPDGQGLPEGSGDVRTGETLYTELCASCHGVFGEGTGRWPVLAGGHGSLEDARPVKTIGSYWPYLSTVWDYVHRAMPFGQAQSLTDNEVYAIVAQLMYLNDLVDEDFVLSNENFLEVRLPNEANFFPDDRAAEEIAALSGEVCMKDCKDSVEITGRAAVIDVTPEDAAARERLEAAAVDGAEVASAETPPPDGDAPATPPTGEASADAVDPALVEAGEKVFRRCRACHQVGENAKNRTGPVLNDLFGRPAGTVDGFGYSAAMAEMGADGLVWTEQSLAAFLADPKGYVEGTKMVFPGLRKEEDLDAVIAYLGTFDE